MDSTVHAELMQLSAEVGALLGGMIYKPDSFLISSDPDLRPLSSALCPLPSVL
jgi:hypothetical protein